MSVVHRVQVDGSNQNADWWLATVSRVLDVRRRRARRMLASQQPGAVDAEPTPDEAPGPGDDEAAPSPTAETAAGGGIPNIIVDGFAGYCHVT